MTTHKFKFFNATFNLRDAQRLVDEKTQHVFGEVSVDDMAHWIQARTGASVGIPIDWDAVDRLTDEDMETPILMASLSDGTHIPIKGWPQLARAKEAGTSTLPCQFLSKRDTLAIMTLS